MYEKEVRAIYSCVPNKKNSIFFRATKEVDYPIKAYYK